MKSVFGHFAQFSPILESNPAPESKPFFPFLHLFEANWGLLTSSGTNLTI